jgi:hypothetical protein
VQSPDLLMLDREAGQVWLCVVLEGPWKESWASSVDRDRMVVETVGYGRGSCCSGVTYVSSNGSNEISGACVFKFTRTNSYSHPDETAIADSSLA